MTPLTRDQHPPMK